MKIYMVMRSASYEGDSIVAVCTSLKKANEICDKYPKWGVDSYTIETYKSNQDGTMDNV